MQKDSMQQQQPQRFGSLENSAEANARMLEDLGISGLGSNSLTDLSMSGLGPSQEQMFHDSLVQSIQELLASEAALEAEAARMPTAAAPPIQAQQDTSGAAALMSALNNLSLQQDQNMAQQQQQQQQQQVTGSRGSLASTLPLETLEMLAAQHLQLLQQAMLAQQPQQQQQQQHQNPSAAAALHASLLNAQPAGHTNDGSLMFVTPQQGGAMGMPSGWVGHRVVALPGDSMKTMGMDLASTLSATSHHGANFSHQHLSVRSEDIMRHTMAGSRTSMPPPASWDHLSASSVPSLQAVLTPSSSGRMSGGADLPSLRELHEFPTVARRGRGRAYGPKSLRQRGVPPPSLHELTNRSGGGAPVRAAAPSWAGADWDPLRNVQSRTVKAGGTGVFLPPGTGVFLPVAEEGSSKGVSPKVVDSGTQYTAAAVEGPGSFDDLPASLMP